MDLTILTWRVNNRCASSNDQYIPLVIVPVRLFSFFISIVNMNIIIIAEIVTQFLWRLFCMMKIIFLIIYERSNNKCSLSQTEKKTIYSAISKCNYIEHRLTFFLSKRLRKKYILFTFEFQILLFFHLLSFLNCKALFCSYYTGFSLPTLILDYINKIPDFITFFL